MSVPELASRPEKKRRIPRNILPTLSAVLAGATWYVMNPGTVEAYARNILELESSQEELIGDAASTIYGNHVLVRCSDKTGPLIVPSGERAHAIAPMLPVVDSPLGVIVLRPWICNALSEFTADPSDGRNREMEAAALHGLAHELSHLMGRDGQTAERRENVADCYGTQRVADVAETLGASPEVALDTARVAASIQDAVFQGYNTIEGCFDGGQYDLDPTRPGVFPPRKS